MTTHLGETPTVDGAVPFLAHVTRRCENCGAPVYAGDVAAWLPDVDLLVCVDCADRTPPGYPT